VKKLQLGIVGFGKLGKACADAIHRDDQVGLAGVLRRKPAMPLPTPFNKIPAVAHISELAQVDAALICVPTGHVAGVAHDLLQRGIPIVECATLHGQAFEDHFNEIDRIASRHKVPAIVGAGWDPGALSVFRSLFALLTSRGHTEMTHRPGVSLHHTTVARTIPGVRSALSTELRTSAGKNQRYVYVELEEGVQLEQVEQLIRSDPLYLDEETLVIPVDSVATLEEEGHGVLMERHGAAGKTAHQLLLLEARYSEPALAAAMMVAAARTLYRCSKRAHTLFELPLGAMWGALHEQARREWI
jgi:diaminopimelate dehydrogenase